MKFNDAKWKIQVHIMYFLDRRNIPLALEISLWLTSPKAIGYWWVGALINIGVLNP